MVQAKFITNGDILKAEEQAFATVKIRYPGYQLREWI